MQGVRLGVPASDDGVHAKPDATEEVFEEATRERIAQGWDDDAVSRSPGPEAPSELTARLADMPSGLDQLTGTRR